MPLFLLIRHGENDYVREGRMAGRLAGVHLNEIGISQAEMLAESLKDLPIKAIYTSPLERAVETAEPIAKTRGLELRIRSALMDTDVGNWQGQVLKSLKKDPLWKTVIGAPSRMKFPGGESFLELQTRLVTEIEAIRQAHSPEDLIACVFHADPIKIILAYFLGMPLDTFQRIHIETGSVSVIFLNEHAAQLLKLNLTPPFELKLPEKRKKKQAGRK